MKYMKRTCSLCLLVLFVLLLGCANTPPVDTKPADKVGIANPASVYCEKQGGKLTIVDGSRGECTLPDGTVCEEWAYLRKECPKRDAIIPDTGSDTGVISGEITPPRPPGDSTLLDVHTCTPDEKKAEICTMDYNPVCGNDGKTYGNGCGACAAGVNSWIPGECRCGSCPQLSPPSPDFCKNGTITAGTVNTCGCQGPPQCII